MEIKLELWHLITLLLAFFGCVWAFGKVLLRQIEKRVTEGFLGLGNRINSVESINRSRMDQMHERQAQLERDLLILRAELPKEYVGREDWIRFSGVIDTKLDRLREYQESTQRTVTAIGEQIKKLGESNGRRN